MTVFTCWRFEEDTRRDRQRWHKGVGTMWVARLELREPAFVLLGTVAFGDTRRFEAARTNPGGNAYHAVGESPRWARVRTVLRMRRYRERAALHPQAALALPQVILCPLGQIN